MKSIGKFASLICLVVIAFVLATSNKLSAVKANSVASTYEHSEGVIIAQNSSAQSQNKPFLVFGFSSDSPPISKGVPGVERGIDSNTFCGVLYEAIDADFSDEYQIVRVPMFSGHRFEGFQKLSINGHGTIEGEEGAKSFFSEDTGNIGIECGPNSIRGYRAEALKTYGGEFSKGFHTTSAKVLIRKVDRALLYKRGYPLSVDANINAGSKVIAVVGGTEPTSGSVICPSGVEPTPNTRVGGTTTVDAINTIYGSAIKEYAVRREALDCLLQSGSRTFAYSTDQILLQGLLREFRNEEPKLNEYVIEPSTHDLTYEKYGVVVYDRGEKPLLSAVNTWIDDNGRDWINAVKSDLSALEYALEGPGSLLFWRPIERFYRVELPLFFALRGTVSTVFLFILSLIVLGIVLTHRFVANALSKFFPQPFRLAIDARRYLREKGDEQNNGLLKWLGSFGLASEEVYALALKESQGDKPTKLSDIDDYVMASILINQFRIVRYVEHMAKEEGKRPEEVKEAIVEQVSHQMKHNPRTQSVVSEWSKWVKRGGDQFSDNFGLTFGRELAVRLVELTIGRGSDPS